MYLSIRLFVLIPWLQGVSHDLLSICSLSSLRINTIIHPAKNLDCTDGNIGFLIGNWGNVEGKSCVETFSYFALSHLTFFDKLVSLWLVGRMDYSLIGCFYGFKLKLINFCNIRFSLSGVSGLTASDLTPGIKQIHTDTVNSIIYKVMYQVECSVIDDSDKSLPRHTRATLAQLRSGPTVGRVLQSSTLHIKICVRCNWMDLFMMKNCMWADATVDLNSVIGVFDFLNLTIRQNDWYNR